MHVSSQSLYIDCYLSVSLSLSLTQSHTHTHTLSLSVSGVPASVGGGVLSQ